MSKTSVYIVLGAKVLANGRPSQTLKRRIQCALDQYRLDTFSKFILCGGMTGQDKSVSEASIMANELIQNGVDETHLILEEQSKNTLENAIFAKAILFSKNLQNENIFVISDDYHLLRARMIFRSIGLDIKSISAAPSPHLSRRILSFIYETMSLVKWGLCWALSCHKKRMAEIL